MPNPNSSGTGFLDVSSWIQPWGKRLGNIWINFTAMSQSTPLRLKAVQARQVNSLVFWPGRAIKIIKAGAPMEMIIPEEGIGWEMQVVAIMKGNKNLEDQKR